MTVRKIEELRTEPVDELLERVIAKYSMGLDIYYEYSTIMAQVLPPGGMPEIRPMIQVSLVCKSKIIGEILYETCAIDLVPVEAFVENGIQTALGDLRTKLAQSGSFLNGQQPQGPTQSIQDRPQA